MTNEEKAREIAQRSVYNFYEARDSALKMAEWKDQQWEKKIREWLTFNTNWTSEFDEEGRNPDYGKIDEMFNDIKNGLI